MAQNLEIDPTTRDYVVADGRPVASDRIQEQAYLALSIPRDGWLYGVEGQGSLLYQLEGQMHTPALEQQFAAYAEDAVQRQLVAKGKASAVAAGNLQQTRTGSLNAVQIVPAEQQLSNQLNFSPV